jgi:Rod binding domain-containing protein
VTDAAIPLAGAPLPIAVGRQPARAADSATSEVRRAAEEFEAVFLAEMLAPMFEGLDTDGLGGGGMGEQIFRPMLVERYAESISRSGGVGIADSIVRELMRLQEAQVIDPEAADGADR